MKLLWLLLLSFLTNAGTVVSPHVPTLNTDLFKIGLKKQNFLLLLFFSVEQLSEWESIVSEFAPFSLQYILEWI